MYIIIISLLLFLSKSKRYKKNNNIFVYENIGGENLEVLLHTREKIKYLSKQDKVKFS